jgi:hypothetical protein
MAKKPSITTVSSGYQSTTTINSNTQNLRDAFDNTLSLDGSTPNAMQADFDMNSNDILNVDKLYLSGLYIDGQPVAPGTLNYNGVIKETQVATSGQTVFNLTTMVYNPGINSLSVYVDGVYQNPSTYTENNSTRITFSAGLHVGAIVDFVALSINEITGGADATTITYTPSAQSLYGTSVITVKSALDQISNEGTGSSKVGFLQSGTGATNRTVQGKLRDTVSVKDFGAVGDGIADDTAAINAAITWVLANPESALLFEETTYLVGSSLTNGQSAFTLTGGTSFTMRGRPTFRVTGTNAKGINLFHIQMSNVDIEYVKAIGDTWTVANITAAIAVGITVVYVQNPTVGTTISGFNFGEVVAENCSRTVLFDANTKTYGLSSDVYIDTIKSTNTCYALNCAQSPNNLVCNQIICDNVFRGYFVYGVNNHVANVEFKSTYTGIFGAGTCANIAVFTESSSGSYANRVQDTRNIHLKLFNISARPTLQISTVSEATTDSAQGMYNIYAESFSTSGTPLKIVNSIGATGDTTTAFASPKNNFYIRAYGPSASLDSSEYGVFNTTNCTSLTLDASNFLDSALAARQSMLTSGWNIIDNRYGRQFFQQYWVAKSGSTSTLAVAVNEDPHLSIGSDSSNLTRWRAGTAHVWYVGGALNAFMNASAFYPWVDNTMTLGGASNRWSTVYAATGTINTSDANDKTDVRPLSEKERAVGAALRGLIRAFKWKADPKETYVGVIAQDVITAFDVEGLDAREYGIVDDTGDRLGVRYDQVFAFVIGAL